MGVKTLKIPCSGDCLCIFP
jgi:hypothetical protein